MSAGKKNPKVEAVIAAGGNGLRMGSKAGRRKQFMLLVNKPVLTYSLAIFHKATAIDAIVLVVPPDEIDYVRQEIVIPYNLDKVQTIVPGGCERQDSVAIGLENLSCDTEIVVIHDGVRPFLTEGMIEESIKEAIQWGACVVGVKSLDTIKEAQGQDLVRWTLERDLLWLIQTPQTFRVSLLREAFSAARKSGFYGTDDASLVERLGYPIKIIKGSSLNIKITTPEDLGMAEAIFKHSLIK